MGKGEKTGMGRLLVKHHNQMIQQSKEKGKHYRSQQKKVLESVTEVNDIDAVIEQADEAHRLFSTINSPANLAINLNDNRCGVQELNDIQSVEIVLGTMNLPQNHTGRIV